MGGKIFGRIQLTRSEGHGPTGRYSKTNIIKETSDPNLATVSGWTNRYGTPHTIKKELDEKSQHRRLKTGQRNISVSVDFC
jgi:hypothetical protein